MPHGADVFVSYTQVDAAWAVWIAWQLEAAGFSTIVQAWDFAEGENFLRQMHEASRGCARTLAVLSPDYVKSRWAMEELWAAHANSRLVPVRAREFMPDGLLRAVIYRDLVGLGAGEAREALLTSVRRALAHQRRARPESAPLFPGVEVPPAVPPFPGPVRFRIPHRLAYFTGRQNELASIDRALASDEPLIVTQTIAGLGGVGKSQLACEYVHSHLHEYRVVAWINAADGGIAHLASLAADLGVGGADLTAAGLARRSLAWLASTDEKWLLVLDNVTGPSDLKTLCPSTGRGRVLVTSRHRGLDEFGNVLRVGVFDLETAEQFLVDRVRRPGDRAAARELADALGNLPLALAHAGAYCAHGTPFAEYLDQLKDLPARELFDRSPEVFYEQTVATTWQVSVAAATADAALASTLLAAAAYLAPAAIPISVLAHQLDDTARGRRALRDGLNALERYSLVDIQDESVAVHRLLQKVVRDDAARREDRSGANVALTGVAGTFPDDITLPESWVACESLLLHVNTLAETAVRLVPPERLVAIMNVASSYLLHAGDSARAGPLAATTTALSQRLLGSDHPLTLEARSHSAGSHWQAGRGAEAVALQEQLLEDRRRSLGNDHPHTVSTGIDVAAAYDEVGRTRDAIALLDHILAGIERLPGFDDLITLRARSNLAVCLSRVGLIKEAMDLQRQVLADRERLQAHDHPDTIRARANLASIVAEVGLTEAIELQQRVLADRERLLRPDHLDLLHARSNLAKWYWQAQRFDEAITLQTRVTTDSEKLLGPEDGHTIIERGFLAQWQHEGASDQRATEDRDVRRERDDPNWTEAVPAEVLNLTVLLNSRHAYPRAEELDKPAPDSGTVIAMVDLGDLYTLRSETAKAESLYRLAHALGNARATLALGHQEEQQGHFQAAEEAFIEAEARDAAEATMALGLLLMRCGRLNEAAAAFQRVEEHGAIGAAVNIEQTATALYNKSIALSQLRRFDEALAGYDQVIEGFADSSERVARELVAKALVRKGVLLRQLERFEEAMGAYDTVIARFGGFRDPALREQVARAMVNKANRLQALGRPDHALALYDNVVADFGDAAQPELRNQVAAALNNMAVTLGELGRSAQEVAVYDDLVARFVDACEPQLRQLSAAAMANKGIALARLGRHDDAIAAFDEVTARFADASEPDFREHVARARNASAQAKRAMDR